MTAHNRSPLDICIDSDATPGGAPAAGGLNSGAVILRRVGSNTIDTSETETTSDTDARPPTSRLAHLLVAIYSDAYGTVIGLDADDVSTYAAAVTAAASSQDSGSDTRRQTADANLTIFGRRDRRS